MKLDPRTILARQRLPDGRVVVLARGPAGVGAYIIERALTHLTHRTEKSGQQGKPRPPKPTAYETENDGGRRRRARVTARCVKYVSAIETPGGDRAPRPVRPPLFTGAGRGAGGQEERT